MKKLIIIFYVLLSLSLYSKTDKQNDIEIGASLGIFTASGLFIDYNLTDDLSLKLSGYLITENSEIEVYESRLSLLYSMINNKNLNFYVISSVFKGNTILRLIFGSNGKYEIQGISAGLGLKFRLSEITNFIFELQAMKSWKDNHYHDLPIIMNVNFGFSFNL